MTGGGGGRQRRRGGTKEDGMQRVNLLRLPLPHEQRRKVGGGGAHKGWQEGEEGEGGVNSLTIWIYCFTNGGEGMENWRKGEDDGEGGGHALGESGQPQSWDSAKPPTDGSHS